jgi:hypothetical protein
MDIFSQTVSSFSLPGHISLRRYDPFLYRYKAYRDSVIDSNILRKATQLVAQIEAARTIPKNPVEALLKARGGRLDTES